MVERAAAAQPAAVHARGTCAASADVHSEAGMTCTAMAGREMRSRALQGDATAPPILLSNLSCCICLRYAAAAALRS